MGAIANVHTTFLPEDRANAEAVARDKEIAVAKIVEAGGAFDDAGRAYWEANTAEAVAAAEKALDLLAAARTILVELPRREADLNAAHEKSEKYLAAIQLGLNHDQYDFPRIMARSAQHASRLVAAIETVLASKDRIVRAMADNQLNDFYLLVSVPGRHLVSAAAEYLATIVRDAQVTHEISAIVEYEWARSGKPENKAAHFVGQPIR